MVDFDEYRRPSDPMCYQHPGVLWAISPDAQISVRLIHTTDWRKKVKKTKSEKLAILRRYSLSGEFLAIFDPLLAIFSKNLCSRGFRFYGMIKLYIWVRFSHFPPLVDFFLKSPCAHIYVTRLSCFCCTEPNI